MGLCNCPDATPPRKSWKRWKGWPVSNRGGEDANQIEFCWALADSEPLWVHGGSYGPEGGAVATGVVAIGIAGTFYLLRGRAARQASEKELAG